MGHTARRAIVIALAATLTASGCTPLADSDRMPTGVAPDSVTSPDTQSPEPSPLTVSTVAPDGELELLVTGLRTPWSIVPLPTGSTLISERDTARVLELTPDGEVRIVGTVTGVVPGGEGGAPGHGRARHGHGLSLRLLHVSVR